MEERPTETKLYNGIQYSVNVPAGESKFVVTIDQGENAVQDIVDCVDIDAENYEELFKRGHQYAEKFINNQPSSAVPENDRTK